MAASQKHNNRQSNFVDPKDMGGLARSQSQLDRVGTNNRANNRQSNATSLMSSGRWANNYLANNDDLDDDPDDDLDSQNLDGFLQSARSEMDDDVDDALSDNRSATNLAPFKKDLGNRFSKQSGRGSFLESNPLAMSAVSMRQKIEEIDELDESRDSLRQSDQFDGMLDDIKRL